MWYFWHNLKSYTTLLKFCLTAPELARLAAKTECMVSISTAASKQHHSLSQATIHRHEEAISKLKAVLSSCNLFKKPDEEGKDNMFKMMSKEIIPQHIQDSILSTEQIGEEAFTSFVKDRITGEGNLWDKLTKVKLLNWTTAGKEIKMKTGSEELTLKASSSLSGC
jgi:hypothetical protein